MRYLLFALLCLAGTAHAAPAKAYLTLIIDDLGQSPARDARTLALPGPVTLAIMPDTPHATAFARQAHKAGKTVILHMPMDPATGPYASGINNHMGSRMTAQPLPMAWLMGELQRRHLFFVDSRTSAATVAAAKAQEQGLASLSRDVFLDDVRTPEAIAGQLRIAVELARRQGSAVLIGHPYPQTLEVLERELPRLKAQGIEWVEIHQMIALRSNQAMAAHGAGGRYRASAGGQ